MGRDRGKCIIPLEAKFEAVENRVVAVEELRRVNGECFVDKFGPPRLSVSFSLSLSSTDLLLTSNSLFFPTPSSLYLLARILSHCDPGTTILSQPDLLIPRRTVPPL